MTNLSDFSGCVLTTMFLFMVLATKTTLTADLCSSNPCGTFPCHSLPEWSTFLCCCPSGIIVSNNCSNAALGKFLIPLIFSLVNAA